MSRYRAISLIELLMVLSIIAVTAAIAAPRYAASLYRYRVDAAARRVAADIGLAQETARNSSASRSLVFDVAGSRYVISGVQSFSNKAADYEVRLRDAPYHAALTSVVLTGGLTTLTFNGEGLPDRGGSVTIASGSNSRVIAIDAVTGEAEVQ